MASPPATVPDHGSIRRRADLRLLGVALALTVVFMGVELAAGLGAHSLALIADAGHMLTDAAAIALSIWAIRLALRPATTTWTFGLKRVEILSAAINGLLLAVVAVLVGTEAVQRLVHPAHVKGWTLVVVAALGVAVNLTVTLVVSRANRASLNVAGVFGHLLTDLWAFLATMVAGVVIVASGLDRADPIASLVVVVLMLRTAWTLLRDSGRILLEGAPGGVDLDDVKVHLLAIEHVHDVHDVHAWVVTSDLPALSAHVVVDASCFLDGHAPQLLDRLQQCLVGHFDVEHSTFQLESLGHLDHEHGTH